MHRQLLSQLLSMGPSGPVVQLQVSPDCDWVEQGQDEQHIASSQSLGVSVLMG